jgi:hypothetical protein
MVARPTAIEPKRELVKVIVEVLVRHGSLVRTHDFSKAQLIRPGVVYCIAGKVNSADKLYLVIESVRLDTKHRVSTVPVPADGAGGPIVR